MEKLFFSTKKKRKATNRNRKSLIFIAIEVDHQLHFRPGFGLLGRLFPGFVAWAAERLSGFCEGVLGEFLGFSKVFFFFS